MLDLDGVLWLGDEPLPGAADAVARFRAAGLAVGFMTNNSSLPLGGYVDKLGRLGVSWENEADGVLRVGGLQPRPALLVDDVVGRSGHGAEVGGERGELVAEAGKGEEFGHHGSPSG